MPPEDASALSLPEGERVTLAAADGRRIEGVEVRASHQYVTCIRLMGDGISFTGQDTFHIVR